MKVQRFLWVPHANFEQISWSRSKSHVKNKFPTSQNCQTAHSLARKDVVLPIQEDSSYQPSQARKCNIRRTNDRFARNRQCSSSR